MPDPIYTKSSSTEAVRSELQDDFLSRLDQDDVFDLVLTIAGSLCDDKDFRRFSMILLEILTLLFMGVRIEDLVRATANKNDSENLLLLLQKERKSQETASKLQMRFSRHSKFGGSFKRVFQVRESRLFSKKGPDRVFSSLGGTQSFDIRTESSEEQPMSVHHKQDDASTYPTQDSGRCRQDKTRFDPLANSAC